MYQTQKSVLQLRLGLSVTRGQWRPQRMPLSVEHKLAKVQRTRRGEEEEEVLERLRHDEAVHLVGLAGGHFAHVFDGGEARFHAPVRCDRPEQPLALPSE